MGYIGTLGFVAFYLSAIVVSICRLLLKNIGNPAYRSWVRRCRFGRLCRLFLRTVDDNIYFLHRVRHLYAVIYMPIRFTWIGRTPTTSSQRASVGCGLWRVVAVAMEPRLFGTFAALMRPISADALRDALQTLPRK